MRVGISLSSTHPVDDLREGARRMVARAAAARDAGLDSLTVGDHHAEARPYYQNVPMLGRLLAEWDDRPAGCLFLVPLWHPVLMAEQIGTLASLHPGTFVVQTGLGRGRAQFAAMGERLEERAARLEEAVPMVRALLAGETVSSARYGIADARIAPGAPDGTVEWWIGAGADVAIDRAARLGDVWYGNADLTPERARDRLEAYRAACERHGREVSCTVRKDVYVGEDDAEAEALAGPLVAGGYRGFPPEAVAYGSVERVAEQLAVYRDLGFDEVVTRTMAVPQEQALGSIARLGEVRRLLQG